MKKVYVSSHGPLWWAGTQVGWEDVWLRFHARRRPVYLAPCLVSREHLRSDIAIYTNIANDSKAPTREFHREVAKKLESILRQLDHQPVVLHVQPSVMPTECLGTVSYLREPGYGMSDVYTSKSWIDRAEAERMMDAYLAAIGVRHCSYKWKRPSVVSTPITVAA